MPVINVVPTLKKLFIKERRYQKYSRRTETHKERERKRMVANLGCTSGETFLCVGSFSFLAN
jgi:hypothetical protein